MFGAISGTIKRTIAGVANAAIFRPTRNNNVQGSIRRQRQSPGKRLRLRDSLIFQRPAFAAVDALVNAASKAGNIQNSRINRAARVEQNVRGSRFLHSGIRSTPSLTSIFAETNSAFVVRRVLVSPHLWSGQIMGAAVNAPHPAAHLGIECDPVSGVAPLFRHSGG